jgi:hypothetical protein
MQSQLDGAWLLTSGQPLPRGVRDVKNIAGGRFMVAADDVATGQPLYSAGGSFTLDGGVYTEHMDFASERLASLVGKDQSFTVSIDGDTFTQEGVLSNGGPLREVWKRIT